MKKEEQASPLLGLGILAVMVFLKICAAIVNFCATHPVTAMLAGVVVIALLWGGLQRLSEARRQRREEERAAVHDAYYRFFFRREPPGEPDGEQFAEPEEEPQPEPDTRRHQAASVLGVSPDATMTEIRRRFRELARKYHPDKFPKATAARQRRQQEQFIRLRQAYEVLVSCGE